MSIAVAEDLVAMVVGVIVLGAIIIGMLLIGVESDYRAERAAEQAKLDTLYAELVGDSNSVRSGLRDVTEQLTELCLVIAPSKGLDESYCTEQPE